MRFGEERRVALWTASGRDLPEAPSTTAFARWGPTMVLPHTCAMEKEFNERIADLEAKGMSRAAAEDQANADTALDRWISVAPLRTYDTIPEHRRAGARQGTRLGTFPVVRDPASGIPECYVDFGRVCTVDVSLIPTRARIGSLSAMAAAQLQYALAMHWAYRDESRLDELERAVGQRIAAVHPTSNGRRLTANLLLEDGSTLTLHASNRPEPPPLQPIRRPRSS